MHILKRTLITASIIAGGWVLFAVLAAAQSPGGAFRPEFNYWVSGQWTWSGANPIVYQPGGQGVGFSTTLAFTTPTAVRTLTFPDATDTLVGKATTDTLTNKTITTINAANPLVFQTNSGGIPTVYWAGSTNSASSAVESSTSNKAHIFAGQATLSAGTASVDTLNPAFTGVDTFACSATYGSGSTGTANLKVVNTSTSKITITGSGSVVVFWMCAGY